MFIPGLFKEKLRTNLGEWHFMSIRSQIVRPPFSRINNKHIMWVLLFLIWQTRSQLMSLLFFSSSPPLAFLSLLFSLPTGRFRNILLYVATHFNI